MRLVLRIDDFYRRRLRDLANYQIPDARRRMVERGLEATLEQTIELNPVETGRSRAAWQRALAELRGAQQAGGIPSGPVAEGWSLGSLELDHQAHTTSGSAVNAVSYVPFLEYGTSRMQPFQMVRRSLAAVRSVIGEWFELG